MNYAEALDYIEQLNTKGIALGLERITALLYLLGNPQEDVRCIHVAGTNGKGSVCAFIDSALRQAGLRVGRYSSPTLYDYLERFQINGVYMDKQQFAKLLTMVRSACDTMAEQGMELPTVFEAETAVAFLYFKQQKCDYVLLEVGMGGRLDSTNVITHPVLSVITSISMDHMAMLGNTLGEIAAEKAGIIKPGCAAVLAPQDAEAMNELQRQCEVCGVVPIVADESQLVPHSWSLYGQIFSYRAWKDITITLTGQYQLINAITALEALYVLQQKEPALTDAVIRNGMAEAKWPGRFDVICKKPLFIVDGAHNPAGAQTLADTVNRLQKPIQENAEQQGDAQKKLWLLMGVFRDKAYVEIGSIMSRCSDTLICFQPPGERGLESGALAEAMAPYYDTITVCETAEQAVQYVLSNASAEDMIISFGSLSTIKTVQDAVQAWEVQQHGAY